MNSNKTITASSHQEPRQDLIDRIQTLEMNQAFQEDSLEAMEKTIMQQHMEIQNLQNKMTLLSDYLKALRQEAGQGGIKSPEDEVPPPHY
ncbi:SlyX family protein [Thiomicrorhabdus arctica]|jgi:SlyX protein|uniref:SlyX family protein n=1 Tax=Thiomicrorhabdus arctica TaxID=131540 RepID=UPI000379EE6E|nr:SlyX family protein [Thiomicrorhabdus arctica]